jgi:hypothetical protein
VNPKDWTLAASHLPSGLEDGTIAAKDKHQIARPAVEGMAELVVDDKRGGGFLEQWEKSFELLGDPRPVGGSQNHHAWARKPLFQPRSMIGFGHGGGPRNLKTTAERQSLAGKSPI